MCSRASTRHRLNVLEAGDHEKFSVDARVPSLARSHPDSPILRDVVINDSKDEPVMVDADLGPGVIEFILEKSIYDMAHFHEAFKEFAILNNLAISKIDSQRVTAKGRPKIGRGLCRPLQREVPKISLSHSFVTNTLVTPRM